MKKKNSPNSPSQAPIGVFDSGLGGLTIVRALRKALPSETILYFGDLARLPYGTKSVEQIRRFSVENTEFLLKNHIKALVIACNSSSSAAYELLRRRFNLPVIDVIEPAVESALKETRTGKIGVLGTQATIESGAYEKALKKRDPSLKVYSVACPLFVPIVEEGLIRHPVSRNMADYYLKPLKKKKVDTVILGCTHYPLLRGVIQDCMGEKVRLIDSAGPCAEKLTGFLNRRHLMKTSGKGRLRIVVSDQPRNFIRVGEGFLREKLHDVHVLR